MIPPEPVGEIDDVESQQSAVSFQSKLDMDASLPKISKVQQIKEEELAIIYQVHEKRDESGDLKRILLGFYGNSVYIWNQTQCMQIFSVDTKGGNRPFRLAVKQNIPMAAFGKVYMLAYAFGDRLHINETWSQMAEQPELILKEQ